TVKVAARNADNNPRIIPQAYCVSNEKMSTRPMMMMMPMTSSPTLIFRRKKNGSITAVKKAAVLRQASATDTLATLMDSKKAIQWAAVMMPVSIRKNTDRFEILAGIRFHAM